MNVIGEKIIEPLRRQVDSLGDAVENITESKTDGILGNDGKIQNRYLPDDIIRSDKVDEPSGVCPLGGDTRVPDNNLPVDLLRTKDKGKKNGVAPLGPDGKVLVTYLPDNIMNNYDYYTYSEVEDILESSEINE